jgi:hypothetical protein
LLHARTLVKLVVVFDILEIFNFNHFIVVVIFCLFRDFWFGWSVAGYIVLNAKVRLIEVAGRNIVVEIEKLVPESFVVDSL